MNKPTETTMKSLQTAFDFFNDRLFYNELPQVLITLNRKRGAKGYFGAEMFKGRNDQTEHNRLDEIALNPDTFAERTDKEILSTLVHEMAHHWQNHFGIKKAKNGYHNKEWVGKMKEIGLTPISLTTGDKGTGVKVTHNITEFGKFDLTCDQLLSDNNVKLEWQSNRILKAYKPRKQYTFRFECPSCGEVAKGHKELNVICGKCLQEMELIDD